MQEEETAEIRSGVSREYFGSFRPRCHASWSLVGKRYPQKGVSGALSVFETRHVRGDASLMPRGKCESMNPFLSSYMFFAA